MNHRTIIITIILMISFMAVIFRLVDIMILNHDYYLSKARGQQIKSEDIPVKRGLILDRKGRELAINIDKDSIYSDGAEVKSPDETARRIASIINQKPEVIKTKIASNKRFVWIERKIDHESSQKIRELRLKGIGLVTEPKRFYPKGSLASHIIGYVDIDNRGLEGAEERFERFLTATPAKKVVMRDAKGNILSEGYHREIKGNNVILTIDEGLQYIVEKNLEAVMTERRAASATAIMMDPYTGEILALASLPNYDLNEPGSSTPAT
ncbi:MAG: hypothetical protein SNJ53_05795, partial [Thermodesulfovibrionales bacterium]